MQANGPAFHEVKITYGFAMYCPCDPIVPNTEGIVIDCC